MIKSEKEISKDTFIENIVNDLNSMPKSYIKTMYGVIHSFKNNIQNNLIDIDFIENWANSFFEAQSASVNPWDSLSKKEREDIEAGIEDLENNRYKNIEQVLLKYD